MSPKAEPMRIGYLTDDPAGDYQRGLTEAEDAAGLRRFLAGWARLAPDARAAARRMKPADFEDFRAGLKMERP